MTFARRKPLSDAAAIKTTTAEKIAIGTLIVGGMAAIVGSILYARAQSQRTQQLRGLLGRVESKTKAGGMTMTHYYDPEMPIQQRVGIMQDLVWKGVKNPQMRELALAITGPGETTVMVGKRKFRVRGANCPARDGLCETEAIYNWTKGFSSVPLKGYDVAGIRYTGDVGPVKMPSGDVEGVDLFQSALRTVEVLGGDCDDHSILNGTLLTLNGIPAQFTISAPAKNADWQHVWAEAGAPKTAPNKWIPVDTTLPGNMFGRSAPAAKKMSFPV